MAPSLREGVGDGWSLSPAAMTGGASHPAHRVFGSPHKSPSMKTGAQTGGIAVGRLAPMAAYPELFTEGPTQREA